MAMKSRTGGGFKSNKVVHRPSPKVEPRSQGIRPQHVAQIGGKYGDHAMEAGGKKLNPIEPAKTRGYNAPIGPNVNAKPNLHPTGSQHGLAQPRELPAGRPVVLERGRS